MSDMTAPAGNVFIIKTPVELKSGFVRSGLSLIIKPLVTATNGKVYIIFYLKAEKENSYF